MTGKERLHVAAGGPMEWLKREWRDCKALWLGLAVLITALAGSGFRFLERY